MPLKPVNGIIDFKIICDNGSMEIFANDGFIATSYIYFPASKTGNINLNGDGNNFKVKKLSLSDIKSIH